MLILVLSQLTHCTVNFFVQLNWRFEERVTETETQRDNAVDIVEGEVGRLYRILKCSMCVFRTTFIFSRYAL